MTTTVSTQLGQFLCALRYADLPKEVTEKAKVCILDAIGTALEGYQLEPVALALDVAEEMSRGGNTTLWGRGAKVDPLSASFANCVAIHALLHDDTLMDSWSHPAGPVVAAAIAVAEAHGASGQDTLLGVVAGYEVMGRLGGPGASLRSRASGVASARIRPTACSARLRQRRASCTSTRLSTRTHSRVPRASPTG